MSSGFTSAVAIIIVSTQVKDILGIRAKGSTFVSIWSSVLDDIHNTTLWDPVLGVACIVVLLLMRVSGVGHDMVTYCTPCTGLVQRLAELAPGG